MSDLSQFAANVGTQQRPLARQDPDAPPPVAQVYTAEASADPTVGFRGDTRMWTGNGNGAYWATGTVASRLPAGLYACTMAQVGCVVVKQEFRTDELLVLPDSATFEVERQIKHFWTLRNAFSSRGFVYKRGILLWGPPGGGKTSCSMLIVKRLIEDHEGIALIGGRDPDVLAGCMQMVRRTEPDRPLVVLLEDIEALVRDGDRESRFLNILDGDAQVSDVIFIGTTNYPEYLDRRFVDRPSRFDSIIYVGMPTPEARRLFLQTKEPTLEAEELDRWVMLSEGFSVAHLRELIILERCFKIPLDDAAHRLRTMIEAKPNSEQAPGRMPAGFIGGLRGAR